MAQQPSANQKPCYKLAVDEWGFWQGKNLTAQLSCQYDVTYYHPPRRPTTAEPQIANSLRRLPTQYIKLNTIESLCSIMVKSSFNSLPDVQLIRKGNDYVYNITVMWNEEYEGDWNHRQGNFYNKGHTDQDPSV